MFIVPKISGGGAEKVITSLASELSEAHVVYLVTTTREDGQEGYAFSKAVHYINLFEGYGNNSLYKKLSNDIKLAWHTIIRKVKKNIRKHILKKSPAGETEHMDAYAFHIQKLTAIKQSLGIDCSISFLNSANYINTLSDAGDKRIISIRSCLSGPYAPQDCQSLEGKARIESACRLADKIIPVSCEAEDNLIREYHADPTKTQVIYNYVDRENITAQSVEFPQGPSRDQLPNDAPDLKELSRIIKAADFVFFASGRLTEKKGQWHMIRAFTEVIKSQPKAILVILGKTGKGNEDTTAFLRRVIKENHLEDHVILAGFYKNPASLLKRGDAFVMTSFNEGFPNALVEAMALSLPVIAADCRSGPREILAPETDCHIKTSEADYAPYGILVPECSGAKKTNAPLEKNEQILADVMKRLINDKDLREYYGKQSLIRIQDFDKQKTLSQWKAVIDEEIQH